jgi:hypothetical protein
LILAVPALVVILWSCGGKTSQGDTNSGGTGPGSLNATLMVHVGGNEPIACTVSQSINWTASSPAGATQSKTSNPVTSATSQCDELSSIESNVKVISCSCPVQVSFTSLAPGNWTVQAGSVGSCTAKVNPGGTSTVTMFTDGRACNTFP